MQSQTSFFYSENANTPTSFKSNVDFPLINNRLVSTSPTEVPSFEEHKHISLSPDTLLKEKEFCSDCSFWKYHPNGHPIQHKSCICDLFASQSVCCLEGYSNLMYQIPYMILYAPTPNKYIFQTIDPYTNPIQINSDQVIKIVSFANNLKLNIIPKLKFPYKNQFFNIIRTKERDGDSQYDIKNTL